jgi:transposase, IS30 family
VVVVSGRGNRRFLTDKARREIWRLRASGLPIREIARLVGQGHGTVHYVVRPMGGVYEPGLLVPRPPSRLSLDNRTEIYVGISAGESFTQIALRIGRNVSTVSREVGGVAGRASYKPVTAHKTALQRARRPKASLLSCRPQLAERVTQDLKAFWSPSQIAARLRTDFPNDQTMWVSHETIYKSIYVQGRGELRRELARCLRSGKTERQPRTRLERRGRIPDMVSISDRPAEVQDRAVPGHWEGDLILGKANGSAVGTLVERSSRFVILLHLPNTHGALQVREAMAAAIATLPTKLCRSITWDQGSEMAQHQTFTIDTGINIYFCDPHSPWQRGTNENTNGLLRQYLPKGTDLSQHTPKDLQTIADSLNNRPRQTLNWATPTETLNHYLATTN